MTAVYSPCGFMSSPGISTCSGIPNISCFSASRKIDEREHSFHETLFVKIMLLLNISINEYCRKVLLHFCTLVTISE